MDNLRTMIPDIRYSDLDTDDEDEIGNILKAMPNDSMQKEAVHGRGDNWTEVGRGFSPYDTSNLVNPGPTGLGGTRWRKNMPSSGDQHINDSKDKQKNTKGRATDNDFDPNIKRKKINDQLDKDRAEEKGRGYSVRVDLGADEMGGKEMAAEIFGEDGKFDDRSIFVDVEDFEAAVRIEREQKERGRSVRIESKQSEQEI